MLKIPIQLDALGRARYAMSQFGAELQKELKVANVNTAAVVLRRIRLKLSNDVLRVRTGTLRRSWSMKAPKPQPTGYGWVGGVGSNLEYARAHEFGVSGTVNVRAHSRRVVKVFGRVAPKGKKANVRAYQRKMRLPASPYARPSIEESVQQARQEHLDAISRAEARLRDRTP